MGREWPYDRRMSERQKMQLRAYAQSPEELAEINEFLSKYQQWVDEIERYEREAEEAKRRRKKMRYKQAMRYYGKLPAEQFLVYLMREGCGMEYEEIAERTGNKPEAPRKNYHDARKNIKRMDLKTAPKQGQQNKR
jgi:DNA-directed RNA polymerase specialized sigma24 family protein